MNEENQQNEVRTVALFHNETLPEFYNRMIDKSLPEPQEELGKSPFDSDLGRNMALDARKVIDGKLKIEDFHQTYHSSLLKEFGDYYASGGEQVSANKGNGVKWAMVIDLKKCVGCDTCTVSCKAENRTPPGISYNVVMEELSGDFPNIQA